MISIHIWVDVWISCEKVEADNEIEKVEINKRWDGQRDIKIQVFRDLAQLTKVLNNNI